MFDQIKKRDGRITEFDSSKITCAIEKAGEATGDARCVELQQQHPAHLAVHRFVDRGSQSVEERRPFGIGEVGYPAKPSCQVGQSRLDQATQRGGERYGHAVSARLGQQQ